MANLNISYIKCLSAIDLVKYLRKERYTEVADIIKSQHLSGQAFLELNELELLKWRLMSKQKKQILECLNTILSKPSRLQPIVKEFHGPVVPRPNLPPFATKTPLLGRTGLRAEATAKDYVNVTQNMQKCRIDSKCIATNEKVKNWQNDTGYFKPEVTNKKIRTLPDSEAHFKNIKSALASQLILTPKGDKSKVAEGESETYLTIVNVAPKCTFESNEQSRSSVPSEEEGIYEVEPDGSDTEEHIYNEAIEPVRSNFSGSIPCKGSNRQLKISPPATSFKHLLPRTSDLQLSNIKTLRSDCNAVDDLSISNFPKPPPFDNKFPRNLVITAKMLLDTKEVVPRKTKMIPDTDKQEFLFNLNNCRFYRNTDRKGAERLLKQIPNVKNGAFLFRRSKKYSMVITMYQEGNFYNVAIEFDDNGKFGCKTNEEEGLKFMTLDEFIEYYEVNPIMVTSNGVCVRIYLRKLLDNIY